MSKLIVDMPMPVKEWNCLDCKAICTDIMRGHYCGITKKTIDTLKNMRARPDWCPIVGVLPEEHGDLIDRDKFVDKYIRHYTEQERKMNLVFAAVEVKQDFADMIYEEDAVIEAERKDDGNSVSNRQKMCGERMQTVTDCHTLEEGNR